MAKSLMFFLAFFGVVSVVSATPWGHIAQGIIATTAEGPALCLPKTAAVGMSLGFADVSDVENQRDFMWRINLKPGATPNVLVPGRCVRYGSRSEKYLLEGPVKALELNRKYYFRVDSAERPKTRTEVFSYYVFFCPKLDADGSVKYIPVGSGNAETCELLVPLSLQWSHPKQDLMGIDNAAG